MLTSITPLGERGRGGRWATTVAAFAVGAMASGAALGAALGALGAVVRLGDVSTAGRLGALAVALGAGLVLDLGLGSLRLPTTRRQVNEDWLGAYRGWVYGVSFGAQLGLGIATVATASAVYLTFLASLLAASTPAGAAIGATFGLVRAASLLPAGRVRQPSQLMALGARLRRWEAPFRRIGLAGQGVLAALAALAALVGPG